VKLTNDLNNDSDFIYLDFSYLHVTDWTIRAKMINYKLTIYNSYVDSSKPFILEYAVLNVNSKNDLRRVLNIVINHRNVIGVFGLRPLNYGYPKRIHMVIKGTIGDSTRYLAHMYNGIEVGAYYKDGVERWGFLFPTYHAADSFINEISKRGKVVNATKKQANLEDYLEWHGHNLNFVLNSTELKALNYAYKRGFFQVPKRAALKDLAKDLGLSPATVDKYIRSAVNKIIRNIFWFNDTT